MMESVQNLDRLDGPFNKLAQSGTGQSTDKEQNNICLLKGIGISRKALQYRFPKKKFITQITCLNLIKVAKEDNSLEWEKRYRNSYYCLENLKTHNGKAYGKFCKNRFCLVCASIRKAMYIERFLPIVETWKDPYFVTLTCKAQKRLVLDKWMLTMVQNFDLVNRRLRKRHSRGRGPKPVGIKALECNYNPVARTYNPHLHLLVASKEIAFEFVYEWMETYGDYYTDPRGQDMRPVRKNKRDLIEVIKYGAKIFTDPDMKKKKDRTKPPEIYAAALHEIYKAMEGRNLLSTFGFKQPNIDPKEVIETLAENNEEWEYESKIRDWVNVDTGQIMTKYIPDGELEYLLTERMDISKN